MYIKITLGLKKSLSGKIARHFNVSYENYKSCCIVLIDHQHCICLFRPKA